MNIDVCLKNFNETFRDIDEQASVDLKVLTDYVSVPSNPFANFHHL